MNTSAQIYRSRISKVIGFLSENPDNDPSLQEMAAIACLSPFHFHRIFSALTGETIGAYKRRLHLERAAFMLKYQPNRSITDIALSTGFTSGSTFTRAFRNQFRCSPKELRSGHQIHPVKKQMPHTGNAMPSSIKSVEILHLKNIPVFIHRFTGSYRDFSVRDEWCKHISDARIKGLLSTGNRFYGIVYDDPGITADSKCRYDCCISVASGAAECTRTIPGGKHAVFTVAPVNQTGCHSIYEWIYGSWLPDSNYEPADAPCYDDYFNFTPGSKPTDRPLQVYRICLPIKNSKY